MPRCTATLLAGPGDDMRGADGAMPTTASGADRARSHHAVARGRPTAVIGRQPVATTRWPRAGCGAGPVRARRRRGTGGGVAWPWPPTPELLAALDRLPPADDEPDVDVDAEAAATTARVQRCAASCGPTARWLALRVSASSSSTPCSRCSGRSSSGAASTTASRADDEARAVDRRRSCSSASRSPTGLVTWGYTLVTGRTAERLLYALRIRIFAHLQRLSLDYYDREMGGRIMTRMTTDVDALSQLLQTGLINAIVSLFTCVGVFVFLVVLSPPLALVAASVLPPLFARDVVVPAAARRAAYARARDRSPRQRQPAGEPVGRARRAGATSARTATSPASAT